MYDEKRLDILLDAYLDQELTAAERVELEQVLLASARAREIFWDRSREHFLIREWGMERWGANLAAQPQRPAFSDWLRSRVGRWWLRVLSGSAATAAAAIVLLVSWHLGSRKPAPAPEESPDQGVAVLTRAAGVEWAKASENPVPGSPLPPGWLRLKAGMLNVEFYSGARLLIEGPAEVQVISATEAFCRSGRVNAYVPEQAHGFKLGSPQVDVVDLGTAFGVNVPAAGATEVHVFTGKIELTRVGGQVTNREVTEGNALTVNPAGKVSSIKAAPADFTTLTELSKKQNSELSVRLQAWRDSNEAINRDPATLVHYTFEGEPDLDRQLKNWVRNAPSATEGTLVGCDWVTGRWPGKSALEFKSRSDRVRLNVAGTHAALTCIAWARVDSLARNFNGLLLSDNLGISEARWEITRAGELSFGVRVASNVWEHAMSPAVITPDRFGQWLQLASVYDADAGTVKHYVNGKEVASIRFKRPMPARFGDAELGNWAVQPDNPLLLRNDEAYLVRAFNGLIDEVIISSRPFKGDEIRQRYEIGKPSAAISMLSPP
jgi:hypothetical protein